MHELTCDEVQDAAPQFALDILEPSARADVAAHLVRCPGCREEVTDMQASAARLLDLKDQTELGPEQWVSEGRPPDRDASDLFVPDGYLADYPLDGDPDSPRVPIGRRRLRVVITLTAVAALFIGTALGPELSRPASSPPRPLASAQLLQANRAVGMVNFYVRHLPAIELAVRGVTASGRLTCVLVGLDGRPVEVGSFKLFEGSGYWGYSTRIDPSLVASFELVDSSGRVVASALMS